jgi:uncharacterized protein YcgI (DUF1989 family)
MDPAGRTAVGDLKRLTDHPATQGGGVDLERYVLTVELEPEFYERLRAKRSRFGLVDEFIIPENTGKGFVVKRGQVARFLIIEGPQIADIDFFNANDYSEHLWANQTMNREGNWLTTFSRLWSNMPHFRPLVTIIEDTLRTRPGDGRFFHHHISGAHCNPYSWLLATGRWDHPNCYDNLASAIGPFGLGPESVHDNLNLFQKTAKHIDGANITEGSDAVVGDFVEFYAEMDILVAVSLCPQGSAKTLPHDPFQDTHPIGIEIYETGVEPMEFSYEGYAGELIHTD